MPSTGLHYNERGILAVNTIPWYHFVRYILNPEELCNFEFVSNEHRTDPPRLSGPYLSAFVYIFLLTSVLDP
jgi:hypothetical protein